MHLKPSRGDALNVGETHQGPANTRKALHAPPATLVARMRKQAKRMYGVTRVCVGRRLPWKGGVKGREGHLQAWGEGHAASLPPGLTPREPALADRACCMPQFDPRARIIAGSTFYPV